MKRLSVSILLSIWLAVSIGSLALGFVFGGRLALPAVNLSTLCLVYAPWLVVSWLVIRAWRKNSTKVAE